MASRCVSAISDLNPEIAAQAHSYLKINNYPISLICANSVTYIYIYIACYHGNRLMWLGLIFLYIDL